MILVEIFEIRPLSIITRRLFEILCEFDQRYAKQKLHLFKFFCFGGKTILFRIYRFDSIHIDRRQNVIKKVFYFIFSNDIPYLQGAKFCWCHIFI